MSLEDHMGVVSSNIEQFNRFVWDNRQTLENQSIGKDKDDIAEYLLQAHLISQDSKFNDDVTLLQTNVNDGMSSKNAEQLIFEVFNFYTPHNKGI